MANDSSTTSTVSAARWVALTNARYHSDRESFLGFADRL